MRVPRVSLAPAGAPGYSAPDVAVPFQGPQGPEKQLGGDLAQAGSNLARAQGREQAQLDEARTSETFSLFADKARALWEDPKEGYRHKVGKAAVEGREGALKALEEARKQLDGGLQNDVQRREFARLADQHSRTVLSHIDNHYATESKNYDLGQTEASAEQFGRDAVTFFDPQDPKAGEMYRAGALRRADEYATKAGLPPAAADALRLAANTKIHAGRVDEMVAGGRPDQARAYLEALPATEIDPAKAADLRRLVQRGGINAEGTRLALELMTPPPPKQEPKAVNGTPATQESDVDRLQREEQERLIRLQTVTEELNRRFLAGVVSAEVRDRALGEMRSIEASRRQDLAERKQQVLAQAERHLAANPFAAVDSLPADLQVAVETLGLQDAVNNFADGRRYSTDPRALLEVLQMPPEALRGVTRARLYAAYRGRLSDADLNKAFAQHAAALEAKDPNVTRLATNGERAIAAARSSGILPPDPHTTASQDQAEDFYRFQVEVDKRLARLGREAKPDEVQQAIDDVTIDRVYRDVGGIFAADPLEPVATLTEDELRDAYVQVGGENVRLDAIPSAEVEKITAKLRAAGEAPTKRAIAEVWVAGGKRR